MVARSRSLRRNLKSQQTQPVRFRQRRQFLHLGNNPTARPAIQPPQPTLPPSAPRRYFAIVDASHGGLDRGEALSPTLAEKDVTVAFPAACGRNRKPGISTLVLRDSDANLSLDDRAFYTNSTRAAVYIALHAASNGQGVRLYTAMLPYVTGDDQGPFRLWSTAQSSSMQLSEATAASVATELESCSYRFAL